MASIAPREVPAGPSEALHLDDVTGVFRPPDNPGETGDAGREAGAR